METLVGSTGIVTFSVPNDLTAASFAVYRNDVQVGTDAAADVSNGVASCDLSYAAVSVDDELLVELAFTYESEPYVRSETVSVVTPILSPVNIKKILGPEATDEEVQDIERAVRLIINAYTGQEFRPYIGEHTVRGSGFEYLNLPQRLIAATSINGRVGQIHIETSGFSLYGYNDFDDYGWPFDDNSPFEPELPSHGTVISTAPRGRYRFYSGERYVVSGLWGYQSVPAPVQEAARLLINDYACMDSAYRDRYLESIKAADWRLGFSAQAYQGTGNVRADQLLADYIMPSMGVI